jgi:Heavy metal binding domain
VRVCEVSGGSGRRCHPSHGARAFKVTQRLLVPKAGMKRVLMILALSACAAQPRVVAPDDPSNPGAPAGTLPLERASVQAPAEAAAPSAELACPMHPGVKGAAGAKCVKCGMALTVPVP